MGLKHNFIFGILGGIVCTQALASNTSKYNIDDFEIGGTLIFQREEYSGVLTDTGSSRSSSFLRKADAKLKIPIYAETAFKLKLKSKKSGDVVVSDAYINSDLNHGLSIKAGRFDPEFGHELTGSTSWTTAIERSSIYDLLVLSGDGSDGEGVSLSYSTDAFHGNFSAYRIPDGLFYSSRLVTISSPVKHHCTTLGFSVTYTNDELTDVGTINSDLGFWYLGDDSDANSIKLAESSYVNPIKLARSYQDDDVISDNLEMGLELAYQRYNTLFQAEYVRRDYTYLDNLTDTLAEGYSLQLAYTLTGESRRFDKSNATYKGIKPNHNFRLIPGAWEVFFRHEDLKVAQIPKSSTNGEPSEVNRANVSTAGINWYYREDIRISASYSKIYAPADDNDEGEIRGSGMALRTQLIF
jgi:phosphate-selective porin OprO/OprP